LKLISKPYVALRKQQQHTSGTWSRWNEWL